MQPVSANFLAAITQSHTLATAVDVVDPDGVVVRLQPLSGSVEVNGTDAVRRTGQFSFLDVDGTLGMQTKEGVLQPYGNELWPYRGVVLADGGASTTPTSMIANGSFEDSTSGWGVNPFYSWDIGTFVASPAEAYSGSRSGLFTFPTSSIGTSGILCPTTVQSGATYVFSGYVYVPTGSPDLKPIVWALGEGATITAKDAWTPFTWTWTNWSGYTAAGFGMQNAAGFDAGDVFYIDGVTLYEGEYPQQQVTRTASTELVQLGALVIVETKPSVDDAGIVLEVTCQDRSVRCQRPLTNWVSVASGTTLSAAVEQILGGVWPRAWGPLTVTPVLETVPGLAIGTGEEPWTICRDLAQQYGFDLYFDHMGRLQMVQWPDPRNADPIARFSRGERGVILSASTSASQADVFNGVIVVAESPEGGDAVRGEAWDMDPSSPTYRYGAFGERPLQVTSSAALDAAAATDAATSLFNGMSGSGVELEWTQLVNPALDVLDVVQVDGYGLTPAVKVALDRLTIPLEADGTMGASGRMFPTVEVVEAVAQEAGPPVQVIVVLDSFNLQAAIAQPTLQTATTVEPAAVTGTTAIGSPWILDIEDNIAYPVTIAGSTGVGAPTVTTSTQISPAIVTGSTAIGVPTASSGIFPPPINLTADVGLTWIIWQHIARPDAIYGTTSIPAATPYEVGGEGPYNEAEAYDSDETYDG